MPLAAAAFFMVSGGPYGIEDILGGAGYGGALLILLILPLVWTLPTTLMICELASALPHDGGFYVWVRRALGPFWGFQEAWLSLAASVFDMAIYPTLFALYLGRLAPALTAGRRALVWELGLIAVCCAWNMRGAPAVGTGSAWMSALLLAPFALLTVFAFRHPAAHGVWTLRSEGGLSTAILVGMWNYMGWDNTSTIAGEVKNPARAYPLAMLLSAGITALAYTLPLAAAAWAGVSPGAFSTGSWVDAARTVAGPWLGMLVVAGGMLNGAGMFNALTLSYTRLPMVLAEEGLLPRVLARRNRRGAPVAAILACAAAWALALGFRYERLISIDLVLYGSSLVLEFLALLVLRVREPDLPRPFRMGPFSVAAGLSLLPVGLVGYALWVARGERLFGMSALAFGVLTALAGGLIYLAMRRRTIFYRPRRLLLR